MHLSLIGDGRGHQRRSWEDIQPLKTLMDSRRLVFGEVNSITDCSNRSEVLLVVDHDGFLHDHNCCLESHRLADSISLQNMLKMVSGLVTNPSPKQQSASSSNLTLSHFKRRESPESVEQISPLVEKSSHE
ncbi:hypothetical protein QYF36_012814 [Acer negundo]|nr:hypothetical protein QYF36_012814 [Acer negundo]